MQARLRIEVHAGRILSTAHALVGCTQAGCSVCTRTHMMHGGEISLPAACLTIMLPVRHTL